MPRMLSLALCLLLPTIALPTLAAPTSPAPLTTVAERSGFVRTGRYDEVIALCSAFASRYPQTVRCIDYGTTPEGRPMKALVVSTSGTLDAATAAKRHLPVVLIQAGIHAGEIEGKDGGFLALRQILDGKTATGVLDHQVWLFVPVFNVDGHERFGAWNRPNQRGPEEMGWRTTAQNLNLNRDYMKADAPEMQAMLTLVDKWNPLLYVDLHTTDGAQFRQDVSIQVEPIHGGDPELRKDGLALRDQVIDDLAHQGSLPLPYYPSLAASDDPSSGFVDTMFAPRFSHSYFLLRNRFGMLIETHSWKRYPERVRIMRNAIVSVLQRTAANGASWLADTEAADQRATEAAGKPQTMTYRTTDKVRMVDFLGYAYTRTHSDISGALMTRYDESKPQVWHVPLREEIVPDIVVAAPRAGYIVPAADAGWVGDKLALHGIAYEVVGKTGARDVQTFRADQVEFATKPMEGHQRLHIDGHWKPERRQVRTGALFVPIDQPESRLVMALLEPSAPDSLLQWGMFNNAFERKEYMEAYVAEDVARDMLAKDPALRASFERKLKEDPAFASNPRARLEFFYRRHPSWDERYDLYPVMRIDVHP